MTLSLKPDPDGLGYYYGTYTDAAGHTHRIDILPPTSEPRAPFSLPNANAHATDWIVYADADEVARVSRRADVDAAVQRCLAPR